MTSLGEERKTQPPDLIISPVFNLILTHGSWLKSPGIHGSNQWICPTLLLKLWLRYKQIQGNFSTYYKTDFGALERKLVYSNMLFNEKVSTKIFVATPTGDINGVVTKNWPLLGIFSGLRMPPYLGESSLTLFWPQGSASVPSPFQRMMSRTFKGSVGTTSGSRTLQCVSAPGLWAPSWAILNVLLWITSLPPMN